MLCTPEIPEKAPGRGDVHPFSSQDPGLEAFSYMTLSTLKLMVQSYSPSSHQFYLLK